MLLQLQKLSNATFKNFQKTAAGLKINFFVTTGIQLWHYQQALCIK
jgi:hypothetical protein